MPDEHFYHLADLAVEELMGGVFSTLDEDLQRALRPRLVGPILTGILAAVAISREKPRKVLKRKFVHLRPSPN